MIKLNIITIASWDIKLLMNISEHHSIIPEHFSTAFRNFLPVRKFFYRTFSVR